MQCRVLPAFIFGGAPSPLRHVDQGSFTSLANVNRSSAAPSSDACLPSRVDSPTRRPHRFDLGTVTLAVTTATAAAAAPAADDDNDDDDASKVAGFGTNTPKTTGMNRILSSPTNSNGAPPRTVTTNPLGSDKLMHGRLGIRDPWAPGSLPPGVPDARPPPLDVHLFLPNPSTTIPTATEPPSRNSPSFPSYPSPSSSSASASLPLSTLVPTIRNTDVQNGDDPVEPLLVSEQSLSTQSVDSPVGDQTRERSETSIRELAGGSRSHENSQVVNGVGNDERATELEQDFLVNIAGEKSPGTFSKTVAKPWDATTGVQGLSYLGRRVEFLRRRGRLLQQSYEECRRITERFSKTFYMGTTLLSPEKRKATWAVYTWCRRTDELVDGPRVVQRAAILRNVIDDWNVRLEDIFYRGKARDALDLVLIDVCTTFPNMSITPFREMINGMLMDVNQSRFQTWEELYLYCYRVAGTVGLMTLPIMGTVKPGREGLHEASEAALALGIALQLTNILRDVGEDRLRGRIYLPLEDLYRFNYTEDDLMNCVLDSRYKSLIKFEIARARKYYAKAQRGIPLLAPESRLPVQASLDMYSQILDVIEDNDYDNFHRRAYISKRKKLATIPLSFLRIKEDAKSKHVLRLMEWLYGVRKA